MGTIIEKLRTQVGFDSYKRNDIINELLLDAWQPETYEVEEVHESFEEGGRWSNYEIKVYKVIEGEDVAYFKVRQEVPATEMQDGGYMNTSFYEVKPKEKTIIFYE